MWRSARKALTERERVLRVPRQRSLEEFRNVSSGSPSAPAAAHPIQETTMGNPHLSRRSFLTAVSAGAAAVTAAPLLAACGDGGSGSDGKVTIEWMDIATTEPSKTIYPKIAKAYEA